MHTSLKNGPLRIPSHAVVRPSRWGPAPFPHAPPPSEIATRFVTDRIACTLRHCPLSCHFIPVHYKYHTTCFGKSIPGVQQGHNAKLDKWCLIDICPITETGDLQCRLRCRSVCLSVGCTTRALPFLVWLQEQRGQQLEGRPQHAPGCNNSTSFIVAHPTGMRGFSFTVKHRTLRKSAKAINEIG